MKNWNKAQYVVLGVFLPIKSIVNISKFLEVLEKSGDEYITLALGHIMFVNEIDKTINKKELEKAIFPYNILIK
jgi:hypothetical protein